MLALRSSTRELKAELDPDLDDTSFKLRLESQPADIGRGSGLGI